MARTFTVNEVSRMLIQSLKVLSKTISRLSMFSEIGMLRARKKFFTRAAEYVQRL